MNLNSKGVALLSGILVVLALIVTGGYFGWKSIHLGLRQNIPQNKSGQTNIAVSGVGASTSQTNPAAAGKPSPTASGVKSSTPLTAASQPSLPKVTVPAAQTTNEASTQDSSDASTVGTNGNSDTSDNGSNDADDATNTEQFTVELNATTSADVAQSLTDNGYIATSSQNAFTALAAESSSINNNGFMPGAYKLSSTMSMSQILNVLEQAPYMKWVVIPEGLRKEEIGNLLAETFNWSASDNQQFIAATNVNPDYTEGVYFPDTYLIPVTDSPTDMANRLVAKFNEKFAPFLPQFTAQDIKWTTGLTLASIVQREAASDSDMSLIAGILWNRLNQSMPLDVDATLQYARGNTGNGYWAPITVADKKIDSPYNTYINAGLPPHPISNPGLPAIEAVLSPASTTCLYYIHDSHQITHCATTYAEQEANVQEYLIGTSTNS